MRRSVQCLVWVPCALALELSTVGTIFNVALADQPDRPSPQVRGDSAVCPNGYLRGWAKGPSLGGLEKFARSHALYFGLLQAGKAQSNGRKATVSRNLDGDASTRVYLFDTTKAMEALFAEYKTNPKSQEAVEAIETGLLRQSDEQLLANAQWHSVEWLLIYSSSVNMIEIVNMSRSEGTEKMALAEFWEDSRDAGVAKSKPFDRDTDISALIDEMRESARPWNVVDQSIWSCEGPNLVLRVAGRIGSTGVNKYGETLSRTDHVYVRSYSIALTPE